MSRENIGLLAKINADYPEKNLHFLQKLNDDWRTRQPLKGYRILHNLVNSFETLHKLESLLYSGAELTVTAVDLISTPFRAEVEEIMARCQIRYIPHYRDLSGEFDIGMDCAARLLSLSAVSFQVGTVELTQSGTVIYRNSSTPYPTLSVDDSYLKNLECMYGTGEAFVRAITELTGADLRDLQFLVFGFGKIGQGIVKYLSLQTQSITIVEQSSQGRDLAARRGWTVLSPIDKKGIVAAAKKAFAIVTATGVPHVLSTYLSVDDVGNAYIANMGANNEIGNEFTYYPRVLFNSAPINFSLKHPTRMKYLDPIFYAHNAAAEHLIQLKAEAKSGYQIFDAQFDRRIVEEWVSVHHEPVSDIWESR